jgi:Holliday junction resolvasome RuvABC endonuclease subunit
MKKKTLAQIVQSIPQPTSPLVGQLTSLAKFVGMPVKALTLGAVNWAQTTPHSLDDVLSLSAYVTRQPIAIPFPWNGINFLLAVDPGSVCMGWAVIRLPGGSPVLGETLSVPLPGEVVDAGVWRLDGPGDIYTRIARFVDHTQLFPYSKGIRALAIEDQFVGGNPHTSLIIGRARGWVEFWATRDLSIIDFFPLSPSEIKQGFVGKGNATKEVMTAQAERLFPLQHVLKSFRDNAADAIAIGHAAYGACLEKYPGALSSPYKRKS